MIPKGIRQQLKDMGIPCFFGAQIQNWASGERYKSGDYIIYCSGEEVISVRKKAEWVYRKGE